MKKTYSADFIKSLPAAIAMLPANAYLVGGCVRDLLLGLAPADYDLVVNGDVKAAAAAFADAQRFKLIDLGNDRYQLWRVVGEGFQVDFVPLNGESLAEDLSRRDFTVNAMAYAPHTGVFTDLFNGVEHLRQGLISMISPAAFLDDPLRLLRAYRFAAALNFEIDAATGAAIRQYSHLGAQPAAERILTELKKMFAAQRTVRQVRAMKDSSLLFVLFPELCSMEEHRANNFSDATAMEHTFRTLECLEDLLLKPAEIISADIAKMEKFREIHTDPQAWFRLKLAALLHDVGKPVSKSIGLDGRVHYYTHEDLGGNIAVEICNRLRCSKSDTLLISSYIAAHMRALTMFNNHRKAKRPLHKRAGFYLDNDVLLPGLFYIFLADALSKRDSLKDGYLDFIEDLIKVYVCEYLPRNKRPLPVNGHDLYRAFSPPSYMLSHMVRDIAVENVIRETFTADEALKVARDTYHMLKSRTR